MKKGFIVFWMVALFGFGCLEENTGNAGQATQAMGDSAAFTSIEWKDSVRNMGSIREGQKLEVAFRFANAGSKPLVIQSVQASCGCTVPSKPEEPIMPGQQGEIKALFDSKGRPGHNHKTITVMANTQGNQSHVLEFNVEVIGEKEGPKAVNGPVGG